MKKQILISLILSCSILIVNAQWSGNTTSIEGNLWRNGNVGIGVNAPSEKLEVNSTILISSPQSRGSSFLRLQRGSEGADNATISFGQNSNYNWHTGLLYAAGTSTPNFYISQSHQITDGTGTLVHTPELTISTNGNIGIGQIMPTEKLEVNSTILINNPQSRGSSFLRLQRGSEGADNATISFGQNGNYNWHTGLLYAAGNSTPNFYISQSHQITDFTGTLVHTPELTISTNGNIGIGTTTPDGLLTVGSTSNRGVINIVGESSSGKWSSLFFTDKNTSPDSRNYAIYNGVIPNIGTSTGLFSIVDLTSSKVRFSIDKVGYIGIGTPTPKYKLDVIGTIRASEIIVDLNGADFVFEKDYKLMPLNELEQFVKKEKHLPEVATAKEMKENGTDLGNLNSKLLQKVEELTLYVIEQNKKIERLENELKK